MAELARQGVTMICVTHEMDCVRKVADRVVFMDQGRIVKEDDPGSFFNHAQNERTQKFLKQFLQH